MNLLFVLEVGFGSGLEIGYQVDSLLQRNLDVGPCSLDPIAQKDEIVEHQGKHTENQKYRGREGGCDEVGRGVGSGGGEKEQDKHHDATETATKQK